MYHIQLAGQRLVTVLSEENKPLLSYNDKNDIL